MYITKEHEDIINSIDGIGGNVLNCGAPEIVTGSRDGTLFYVIYILYLSFFYYGCYIIFSQVSYDKLNIV